MPSPLSPLWYVTPSTESEPQRKINNNNNNNKHENSLTGAPGEDPLHQVDLMGLLLVVGLVDADGVDPDEVAVRLAAELRQRRVDVLPHGALVPVDSDRLGRRAGAPDVRERVVRQVRGLNVDEVEEAFYRQVFLFAAVAAWQDF